MLLIWNIISDTRNQNQSWKSWNSEQNFTWKGESAYLYRGHLLSVASKDQINVTRCANFTTKYEFLSLSMNTYVFIVLTVETTNTRVQLYCTIRALIPADRYNGYKYETSSLTVISLGMCNVCSLTADRIRWSTCNTEAAATKPTRYVYTKKQIHFTYLFSVIHSSVTIYILLLFYWH